MEIGVKEIPKVNRGRRIGVYWRDIKIAYLLRDEAGYAFKYDQMGLKKAREEGYTYLVGFKDTRKIYQSEQLFAFFKNRVPSRERRELSQRLRALGIQEYDEFEILLAKSGRTNTDQITLKEEEYHKEDLRRRLSGIKKEKMIPIDEKEDKINGR